LNGSAAALYPGTILLYETCFVILSNIPGMCVLIEGIVLPEELSSIYIHSVPNTQGFLM
jgi:hypothetical protein